MSVAANAIDQKEYLKKYLSGNKTKKKKIKKHKHEKTNVKIIDDIAFAHTENTIDEELLLTGEDAPQIVGEVFEENPAEKTPAWRSITIKDDPEDEYETKETKQQQNIWGGKPLDRKIKDEFSPTRRKIKIEKESPPKTVPSKKSSKQIRECDLSPPRKKNFNNGGEIDSDLSPPRKGMHLSPQRKKKSPKREKQSNTPRRNDSKQSLRSRYNSDSDQSPVRQRKTNPTVRRQQRDESVDHSPPRKSGKYLTENYKSNSDSDSSSLQRNNKHLERSKLKNYSDYDQSPPRRSKQQQQSENLDQSPPRKSKQQSESRKHKFNCDLDQSPPRRSRKYSPPRRQDNREKMKEKYNADSDQSPPRKSKEYAENKKHKFNSDLDQSPPRRSRKDSPNNKRKNYDSDQSPVRNKSKNGHSNCTDFRKRQVNTSPLHIKHEKTRDGASPSRNATQTNRKFTRWGMKNERDKSISPPPTHKPKATKTLDGKKAGLQGAKSLMVENEERRRAEECLFAEMSNEVSGRDAEIAVRSTGRKGRRAREAAEEDPEKIREREERAKQKKEVYDRWGKGLKQVEDRRAQLEMEAYEGSKPLARYANDDDLDRYLREKERCEDPMLEYMREKKREQMKDANIPIMPTYQGTFPENRFGIKPGYRWDGVDRSNGYEKRWFEVQNEKVARAEEAYKYSVEDM